MKSYPKHPRIEDKAYLEFIRHEPCLACVELRRRLEPVGYFLGFSNIEAHHPKATRYGGNLGWNVKADDRKAMPLCRVIILSLKMEKKDFIESMVLNHTRK